jgi:hypothetical protein
MYVMQITGMGAAKMSASSTQWQLRQQDNGQQLQPQTRTRACKHKPANTHEQVQAHPIGHTHMNEHRRTRMREDERTQTRAGEWVWANEGGGMGAGKHE